MCYKQNITFDDIKNLVQHSLEDFYTQDSILFDCSAENEAVSERCMMFRIGWYMLTRMKTLEKFHWADLDCEYNRHFEDIKSMHVFGLYGYSQESKGIIPDLLIHKRMSDENNLLVIEFKKGTPSSERRNNDYRKLTYFTDTSKEYSYDVGLYIELHKNEAIVKVYQDGAHKKHLDYTVYPY